MTSQGPKRSRGWARFALIAVVMSTSSATFLAACGGGSSCTVCPQYDSSTGPGWCKPGPNDCQACKVVVCPGYCLYNGSTTTPVLSTQSDGGC